jgi:hypothetical protein
MIHGIFFRQFFKFIIYSCSVFRRKFIENFGKNRHVCIQPCILALVELDTNECRYRFVIVFLQLDVVVRQAEIFQ